MAQTGQTRRRRLRQLGNALDRVDLAHNLSEDRRLVTRAGSDLEHAVARREAQLLRHVRHHRRLRDGLAARDRQGAIVIGGGAERAGHKFLPWHGVHGPQHRGIGNLLQPEVALHDGSLLRAARNVESRIDRA